MIIESKEDYIKVAEDLLGVAKQFAGDKSYVQPNEFCALIGAGAKIDSLNIKQHGGDYVHYVLYGGLVFVSATEEPASFVISPSMRGSSYETRRLEGVVREDR